MRLGLALALLAACAAPTATEGGSEDAARTEATALRVMAFNLRHEGGDKKRSGYEIRKTSKPILWSVSGITRARSRRVRRGSKRGGSGSSESGWRLLCWNRRDALHPGPHDENSVSLYYLHAFSGSFGASQAASG